MSSAELGGLGGTVSRLTGGRAVALALQSLGVTTVFGIPSVHNMPVMDALRATGSLRLVTTRHEQAAVHAADAYSRVSGRLGVAVVSTGPGTTNAMTGLLEAATASSPVLVITGQVPSIHYGKDKGALHEASRQLVMLRTIVSKAETAWRVDDVPKKIIDVAITALSTRQGPGVVEIPIDVQARGGFVEVPIDIRAPLAAAPDASSVAKAKRILEASARPIVYAGGGVISSNASGELTRFAESLGTPVLTTVNGRGSIPESHPLALGTIPARFQELQGILDEADLLLAIGTRFQGPATNSWRVRMPDPLIHIDIDPRVIDLNYRSSQSVIGDARVTIEQLGASVSKRSADATFFSRVTAQAAAVKTTMRNEIGPDHARIMDVIRSSLPPSSPIVRDATLPAYLWADRLIPIEKPRTSIRPTTGSIGPGIGFALGAALGSDDRVVLIVGDGGAMASLGDLAAIGQEGLPITICLFNDRGYGVLRAIQQDQYDGEIGVDLFTPDFAGYARSVGVRGHRADSVREFTTRFEESLTDDGPFLIEIDANQLAPMDLASFV